eukprot:scaffold123970_cov30-Tisochrysis_lutea.AAC.2
MGMDGGRWYQMRSKRPRRRVSGPRPSNCYARLGSAGQRRWRRNPGRGYLLIAVVGIFKRVLEVSHTLFCHEK